MLHALLNALEDFRERRLQHLQVEFRSQGTYQPNAEKLGGVGGFIGIDDLEVVVADVHDLAWSASL